MVWRRQSHLPTPFAFVYFSVYSISGNGLWEWRRKCQSLPLQRNHRQNRIDKFGQERRDPGLLPYVRRKGDHHLGRLFGGNNDLRLRRAVAAGQGRTARWNGDRVHQRRRRQPADVEGNEGRYGLHRDLHLPRADPGSKGKYIKHITTRNDICDGGFI